jgi:predicted RNase H-like nuclease
MSETVAGADGCRGGWLCVIRQADPPFGEQLFLANALAEILNHPAAPKVVAIDIPIGLPDFIAGAGRSCDIAARKILGKRAGAVFVVPARAALYAADYGGACAAAFAASDPPRKISKQMFHLFPKMQEADGLLTPALQARLFECHPEAAFCLMNGGEPLHEPKKLRGRPNLPGLDFRRALLVTHGYSESFVGAKPPRNSGADDLLDACACGWTAARVLKGEAVRFPEEPPLDAKGLRMEILA